MGRNERQSRGNLNALFRAYFVDVKNIGKVDVLAEIAEENDLPEDEATDVLFSRKFKDAVDADWRRCATYRRQRACRRFLAGKYLMVGAQPYEELQRLIEHVVKEPAVKPGIAVASATRSSVGRSDRRLRQNSIAC